MSQHNNAPFQPKSVLDLIRNYTASLLRNRTLNLNGGGGKERTGAEFDSTWRKKGLIINPS